MTHTIAVQAEAVEPGSPPARQIDAMERALEAEAGCAEIMGLLTAGRGAINGIMAEVVESYPHAYGRADRKTLPRLTRAAEELVRSVRSTIK